MATRTAKPTDTPEPEVDPTAGAEPTDQVEAKPEVADPTDVAALTAELAAARQRVTELEREVARAIQAPTVQAGPLPESVALIHPTRGHVVHVTAAQAEANGWTDWTPATPEQLAAAGLTAG